MALPPSDPMDARRHALLDSVPPGQPLCAALTESLLEQISAVPLPQGMTVLIGGSYARGEPAPFSDVDVAVIHRDGVLVDDPARALLHHLWGAGWTTDHSVRTLDDLAAAATDVRVAHGLIRPLTAAGDPELAAAASGLIHRLWRGRSASYLPELLASADTRERQYGRISDRLSPDLKRARGGLVDAAIIQSIAAAWVAHVDPAPIRSAATVLVDVRGELQRAAGRGTDRLTPELVPIVAARLAMSEREMLDSVRRAGATIASALDHLAPTVRAIAAAALSPRTPARRRPPAWRRLAVGVVERGGEAAVDPAMDADALTGLRLGAAAATAGVPISESSLIIAAAAPPMATPWPQPARELLIELLRAGDGTVSTIGQLDQAGIWGRLLPEWTSVRHRHQHSPVHLFTVDRHLVETARLAAAEPDPAPRADLLVVAALLHDIGKGRAGDHSVVGAPIAAGIASRLGFAAPDVATISAAVRHHLTLVDTVRTRDADDPAVHRALARDLRDADLVRLLAALSRADARATGTPVWTAWKGRLIDRLVAGVLDQLSRESCAGSRSTVTA